MVAPARVPPSEGEVLFARYAYPPNELGYCGPADATPLLAAAAGSGSGSGTTIRECARAFTGAWVYLETIGAAAGLDPLDPRVVEAYWIGNELLDAVDPGEFAAVTRERFAGESGADWAVLDVTGRGHAVANHSFQVLTVYPWVRLLGRGPAPLEVLDRCRIREGEVVELVGDTVLALVRPLCFDGQVLYLGDPVLERATWTDAGRSLPGRIRAGDRIALHWGWVCDRLDATRAAALAARTADQLALTNRAGVLGSRAPRPD